MKKAVVILAVFAIVISCLLGTALSAQGKEEDVPPLNRYYTSVRVEDGDSLWSIAEENNKDTGMTTREYVREIMNINGMISDRINAGQNLLIVYYAEEPAEI